MSDRRNQGRGRAKEGGENEGDRSIHLVLVLEKLGNGGPLWAFSSNPFCPCVCQSHAPLLSLSMLCVPQFQAEGLSRDRAIMDVQWSPHYSELLLAAYNTQAAAGIYTVIILDIQ